MPFFASLHWLPNVSTSEKRLDVEKKEEEKRDLPSDAIRAFFSPLPFLALAKLEIERS